MHIPVKVAGDEQGPWRSHKGWTSQNVMAYVNFDLLFLYVTVGWEGSASDMKVLTWSIDDGSFGVPEGKFYLVDGGYANTHQFLAPYRGYRHHLSTYETGRSRVSYRDRKDLFNHRHAQLRNVVERAFGVLKARFAILTKQRNYPIKTQVKIAMACFLLHNFIKKEQGNDYIFRRVMVNPVSGVDHDDGVEIILRGTDTMRGESLRSGIAARLWARHNRRGQLPRPLVISILREEMLQKLTVPILAIILATTPYHWNRNLCDAPAKDQHRFSWDTSNKTKRIILVIHH